jgi:nucleoside-diphosphate-sugar epimerase
MILEVTGKKGKLERIYVDPEPGEKGRLPAELKDLQCDMSKARKLLGFIPKVTLQQGICRQVSMAKKK